MKDIISSRGTGQIVSNMCSRLNSLKSLKATPYCRAVLGATESCNNRSISVWKSLTKTLPEYRMEFDLPLEPIS